MKGRHPGLHPLVHDFQTALFYRTIFRSDVIFPEVAHVEYLYWFSLSYDYPSPFDIHDIAGINCSSYTQGSIE
jgi:hypothetical protein